MKRVYILLVLFFVVILPLNVNATGGGLRKKSIKTCPNGVTYGMHSDGNGKTHWHIAKTNGKNYYASGKVITSDPCPNSNDNKGIAGSTGNKNNDTNASSNSSTTKPVIEEQKSNDTSLKRVIIDGKDIDMSNSMSYEAYKKNVDIQVIANSKDAKVEFKKPELIIGENIVVINVTAENGDSKKYELKINRIKKVGTASIKKFILGAGEVEFKDNKATIKKLKNETTLEYSYELTDFNAKLIIYHNDKQVEKLENLKSNDVIKLVVIDKDDNENVYEITIEDSSLIYTYLINGLAYIIMGTVFIGPVVALIVYIIYRNKKRKN